MDPFSYLSVLISIVLGMGITQLLTGLGRLMQARQRTRLYWPAIAWVGLLLLIHVQTWWTMFGLRNRVDWTFGAFLVVLLQPAVLYLMSALVLPEFSGDAPVDLRKNYFDHGRWFFGLAVLLLAVSLTKDLVLRGTFPAPLNLVAHLVFLVLWAGAIGTRSERYHRFLAPCTAAVFAAYVIVLFTRLQ